MKNHWILSQNKCHCTEMKQLIILVGLKGSGKNYVGTLLEDKLGIKFLRVEDLWLKIFQNRLSHEYYTEGFHLVELEIERQFKDYDRIVIESTGTSKYFKPYLKRLGDKYKLKLIKIETTPETCRKRIKSRDPSIHIPVSDHIIEQINEEAMNVTLNFDMVINNESSSDEEIVLKFDEIIHSMY